MATKVRANIISMVGLLVYLKPSIKRLVGEKVRLKTLSPGVPELDILFLLWR